jgi:hypothetical protein
VKPLHPGAPLIRVDGIADHNHNRCPAAQAS